MSEKAKIGAEVLEHRASFVACDDVAAVYRSQATAIRDLIASEARLRAALGEIAKPTYGTEWTDTDEDRAEILGRHLFAAQAIARSALANKP